MAFSGAIALGNPLPTGGLPHPSSQPEVDTVTDSFRIAAVQAAPVFLDLDATVSKACRLIEEAAGEGAKLIAFPEAFVPAYPFWVWFIPPGKTHPLRALYSRLHANSVSIPGPERV